MGSTKVEDKARHCLGNEKKSFPYLRNSSSKVFYGDSNEVNQIRFQDYNDFIKNTESKQRMIGFNNTYLDIVDYIVRITHRIWEEKEVELIYHTYHNNIKIHLGTNEVKGVNQVVSNTLQTMLAFPEDKGMAANVIWSGDDENGFYTSHRVSTVSRNLGNSSYGPATGRKIAYRSVADCFCHTNRIVEEWIVRDGLSIVKQLGLNPIEVARKAATLKQDKDVELQQSFGIGDVQEGQLAPIVYNKQYKQFEIGDYILEAYNKILERRLFNCVKEFYPDNAIYNFIDGKTLIGSSQIQGALISIFASFPTAKFIIERVTCNQMNDFNDWEVAVRWRMQGIHEGRGYFGEPSHKPIEILGINHLTVQNEKIVEEWVTFDGIDVLKQIYSL
ncbi:ester cyclase [Priestia megaterium]|uniref:nuclear transport factor 2 family protein n=1 Tax=Priestia megaterium TaxID=1404 RepID=UPI00366F7A18